MLELKNVKKTFNRGSINEKRALSGVNLKLEPGDFVTVIGGNGAGKSTMLNMIAGVYPIDSGAVIIDGKNVTLQPDYKRAAYLGRVFQDPMMGTAADMEIEENLAMAYRRGKRRGLGWGILKQEKKIYHEALQMLELGLEERMSSKVGLLSGGQRQRIGIARALYRKPEVLVLDEATSALDTETEEAVMEAIDSLQGRMTMLIIAHRLSTIKNCDIVYQVENGAVRRKQEA